MAKSTSPAAILKQLEALGSQAAEAIDELLAQKKAIEAETKEKLKAIDDQIAPLNDAHERATGKYYIKIEGGWVSSGKTKRTRRDGAKLAALATKIYEFISKKKDGVLGADLRATFQELEEKDNISLILGKQEGKFKTEGPRKATRYIAV